jgi:REP element-mobilizing transposase RayT
MSRALRIEFPGAIYHVMARGVAGMPVFRDDADRLMLLQEIEAQVRLGVLVVHAFCLMLNHIHLLCETPRAGLGRTMHDILGNFAASFNRLHKRAGHLWQGRYKAILVQDGLYLLRCSRYIHLNPHKAGIDADFRYPWSSYPGYLGGTAFSWVCTDRILRHFSGAGKYQEFVEDRVDDCADPFKQATAGIVYGDPEFVKRIYRVAKHTGGQEDQPAIRLLRRSALEPSIETVLAAIDSALPEVSECQKRRCLVWALHTHTWLKGSAIAREAGLKRSSVSKIIRSIKAGIWPGEEIAKRLASISQQLGLPQKSPSH